MLQRSDVGCPGCGAVFPEIDDPLHEYMESSPACWRAFGEVLPDPNGPHDEFACRGMPV